jgi:prepilin-type processing-associated H-X9-DG protein
MHDPSTHLGKQWRGVTVNEASGYVSSKRIGEISKPDQSIVFTEWANEHNGIGETGNQNGTIGATNLENPAGGHWVHGGFFQSNYLMGDFHVETKSFMDTLEVHEQRDGYRTQSNPWIVDHTTGNVIGTWWDCN